MRAATKLTARAFTIVSTVTANMPKKKSGKKKGKGKGGAKGDAEGKAAAEEDHKPFEAPSSTERELALRSE